MTQICLGIILFLVTVWEFRVKLIFDFLMNFENQWQKSLNLTLNIIFKKHTKLTFNKALDFESYLEQLEVEESEEFPEAEKKESRDLFPDECGFWLKKQNLMINRIIRK